MKIFNVFSCVDCTAIKLTLKFRLATEIMMKHIGSNFWTPYNVTMKSILDDTNYDALIIIIKI